LQVRAPNGDLGIHGQLHFSKVVLDGGKDVLIGERGWIGTDALGHFGGTGPGTTR